MTAPTTDAPTLEQVAYHEAGHALVACLCGVPLRQVSIIEDEASYGTTDITSSADPTRMDSCRRTLWIDRRIMAAYAGHIAVQIQLGQISPGLESDLERVQALARARVGTESDELTLFIGWMYQHTRNLLLRGDVQHALRTLAGELLKRKTISGRLARRIIKNARHEFITGQLAQFGLS